MRISKSLFRRLGCLSLIVILSVDLAYTQDVSKVFWIEGSNIFSANLDGSGEQLVLADAGNVSSLAIDSIENNIYWIDTDQDIIYRFDLGGSGVKDSIASFSVDIDGLHIDLFSRKLFWREATLRVVSADLDGSNVSAIFDGDAPSIVGYDAINSIIYTTSELIISCTDVNTKQLINYVSIVASDVASNPADSTVYLLVGDPTTGNGQIVRGDSACAEFEPIFQTSSLGFFSNLELDPFEQQFYWIDRDGRSIHRSGLDGQNARRIILTAEARNLSLYFPQLNLSSPLQEIPQNGDFLALPNIFLDWEDVAVANSYTLEVDDDESFMSPELDCGGIGLTETSIQCSTLSAYTRYYWRVQACINTTCSDFSSSFTFTTYPPSFTLNESRTFGPLDQTSSWRMVGVPGDGGRPIRLAGTRGKDWQVFTDNGAGDLIPYSGTFERGRGYWMLARDPWEINESVSPPGPSSLAADGAVEISLNNEWTILTNPYDEPLAWASVQAANIGVVDSPQAYNGDYRSAGILQPYEAYYYYNRSKADSLTMPLPVRNVALGGKKETLPDEELVLTFRAQNQESEVRLGIASDADEGLDDLDRFAAPSGFGALTAKVINRHLHTRYKSLQRDVRRAWGKYELNLEAEDLIQVEFASNKSILFTNVESGIRHRVTNSGWLKPGLYELEVLDTEEPADASGPLLEVYPNPMQDRATIRYDLEEAGPVKIEVYDLLGRRVTKLVDQVKEEGEHEVIWRPGKILAPGKYFVAIKLSQRSSFSTVLSIEQ